MTFGDIRRATDGLPDEAGIVLPGGKSGEKAGEKAETETESAGRMA
jgi:hypothetical protein